MPRPLSKALEPAKTSSVITTYRTAAGFVLASILTPTMEPSIMPMMEVSFDKAISVFFLIFVFG